MTARIKTWTPALAALAVGLAAAACGGPKSPDTAATQPTEATVESAAVDGASQTYVEKAAMSDMFEIEASKIALERSMVPAVKTFAQEMIDAHMATSAKLTPIALASGITPPSALDEDHTKKLDDLRNAKQEEFDDKYIDIQTSAHNAALDLNKDFAKNSTNTQLAAFAAEVAPAIEQHLEHVKVLDESDADDVTKKAPADS